MKEKVLKEKEKLQKVVKALKVLKEKEKLQKVIKVLKVLKEKEKLQKVLKENSMLLMDRDSKVDMIT